MRRSMLKRSANRDIRGSIGRYLAILSIVALGVGFFSGVRVTTPVMVHTVDTFYQEKQLYDYRLISTLGWEEADVEAIRQRPDVRYAEGADSLDVLCLDEENTEFVLKAHTIPEHLNLLTLTEGRMPEAANECLMDAGKPGSLKVGDTLRIADTNEDDTIDAFSYKTFQIVGAVHSSLYLNFERGTTSIGTGSIEGYFYVEPDAFTWDYYSEMYVRLNRDDVIYSKDYKDTMEESTPVWETLTQEQAEERFGRVVADAEEELADGRQELEDSRKEGEQELADAAQELTDGKQELDDAETELADAKAELDDAKQQIGQGEAELAQSKKEIDSGQKQLDAAKAELDASQKTLEVSKATLDEAEQQLTDGEAQLADGQAQLQAAAAELDANAETLAVQEQELAAQEQALAGQMLYFDQLPPEQQAALQQAQAQLEQGKAALEAGKAQIEEGRQALAAQQAVLAEKQAELAAARQEWEAGKAAYEAGLAQFETGKQQYEASLKQFNTGKQQYAAGVQQISDARKAYEDGLQQYEDGKADYEDGLAEYEDGLVEYEDGKAEFDEKIADAEQELADAEQEIADLDSPDTYVLDRNTNIGYACFESDSQIVEQVAKVFPVFFILVAALVCMTTMSRMVEEQRTQIGTLKALGYSEGAIMGKFMRYSGSAAIIGCVAGFAVGSVLFPAVIWMSYQLMYIPLQLKFVFDWKMALLAVGASLLCSLGTTWAACRMELAETAAGLMRPKAPKAGKRVFLEYVPFLWNRLKFLHKVSIRNIFRYKGRFFMMIVGISGCTALLVTGFGIKDSIAGFADVQYNEIEVADASMSFRTDIGDTLPADLQAKMDDYTQDYMLVHEAAWDLHADGKVKGITVIAPFEPERMDNYMRLHTLEGEPLAFPQTGEALISNSIAERYHVQPGEELLLQNEDMQEMRLQVTGVFENHVYNYVILSPETIENLTGEEAAFNTAFVNFPDGADIYQSSAEIAKNENVTNINLFRDMQERMGKMMSSLDYIVLLVILCAAGLAFIVLYNLTNINITERIREIATIKVLGFFRRETSAYVLRENIALTAIGIALGLVLGVLLHRFVMAQIIVDMVSFRIKVLSPSFLYSVVLTFVFNFIVNAFMGRKLDRINMAESLKSVD